MRKQNFAKKFARAAVICAACMALPLAAQDYPSKPLRLISPFSAGGGADTVARFFGQKLSAALQQQVVVDNRAGANGIIGAEFIAKSAPDGYAMILASTGVAINPNLYPKMPFDTLRDLAPVTLITSTPELFVVHPSLPVKSIREMVALAKSKPGQLSMA